MQNLTNKFKENLSNAVEIAFKNKNILISPVHFLSSIIVSQNSILNRALIQMDAETDGLIELTEKELNKTLAIKKDFKEENIKMSEEMYSTIEKGSKLMSNNDDSYLSVDTWLMANEDILNSIYGESLDTKKLFATLRLMRGSKKISKPTLDESQSSLDKYGINLNIKALRGELDSTVGREDEINRMMKILMRRTKNNPMILGEPGVGKTNLVEGFAQRIVQGKVPASLKNKVIISLDVTSLIAGASYQGEFEERLKILLEEVKEEGNILLFIDETHTIVGTGNGSSDMANVLKPALARGEIHIIGATTLSEYKQFFEKDPALERRFQEIKLTEPTEHESIQIMRGIKDKLETHHNVLINDSALVAAVELGKRYISDRCLPDKAIDLIDEASAELKMEIESEPLDLSNLRSQLNSLKVEKEALLITNKDKRRINEVIEEITNKEEELISLNAKFETEKKVFHKIGVLKTEIDNLKAVLTNLSRNDEFKKAAKTQETIDKKEKEINKQNEKWQVMMTKGTLLKNFVDEELVSKIISNWTGIPVSKMLESEREKVINMADLLSGKVIGQDNAVNSITDIIQKNKAGLSDADKPIGSFLFLGTSGVGKTHMAKELAKFLFNDSSKMIRFDMSEYQDKSTISRLTGAAPGLIGYEEGGQLTEAVKNNPYSVILFDEVEKAHPDIFNLLLQVLDDGRLTDNKGVTVNFKNTIIILTSNIGSKRIVEITEKDEQRKAVLEELKSFFRPEFINRLDDLIVFNPLELEDLVKISDLLLKDVQKKLNKRHITLTVSPEAKKRVAELGYDPIYGARPLRRSIDDNIEGVLTSVLLRGELDEDMTINFTLKDKEIAYTITKDIA